MYPRPDGDMAVSSQEKTDLLVRQFAEKMTTPEPDRQLPALPRLTVSRLEGVAISEDAIRRHLRDVNTRKAPGPDSVTPHLKKCAVELAGPLAQMFPCCLQRGVWPSLWKEARLTPVHKEKSRSEPGNYRPCYQPISLLSVLSNILERIISEQLTEHLEQHHLLSPK